MQLCCRTVIVCGIKPEVAQVVVSTGLDPRLTTTHDLRSALSLALRVAGRERHLSN